VTEDKLLESTAPNVSELVTDFTRSFSDRRVTNRIREADESRYAYWQGQAADGRKHAVNYGRQVFPWEGASDSRIHLVDNYINHYVALLAGADNRCALNVNPAEYQDVENASAVQLYMNWLVSTLLNPSWDDELELAQQYAAHYGWAGVHTLWKRSQQMSPRELTIESMAKSMGVEDPAEMVAAFDQNSDMLADIFATSNPQFKVSEVRKKFKELRTNGKTVIEMPEIVCDHPEIVTLKPFYELLFPPETREIYRARVVFRRDSFTVAELEDRAQTDEWDEQWVEEVKATAGRYINHNDEGISPAQQTVDSANDHQNMVEVIYAYSRRVDEHGRPGVYLTVFSPHHKNDDTGEPSYASHTLVKEAGGRIPIEVFTRERTTRELLESRGIPDICGTWQTEIKGQVDMVFDRSNLETLPPLKVPHRYGNRISVGPGKQLSEQRPGDISWMEPPKKGPDVALANIESVRLRADEYFGVPNPAIDPAQSQVKNQMHVSRWLRFKGTILNNVWELVQKFGNDKEFGEVTGTGLPIPEDTKKYNFSLSFDIRELDSEFTNNQLKAISEIVLPNDLAGQIDRRKLLEMQLRIINPTFPEQLLLDNKQAAQQMFEEENNTVALMALGNQPQLRENDPSAQIRAQFVNQIIGNNPKYMELMQSDPQFVELVQTYMKNLNMSVMQQQNAMTGRLGVNQNG